MARAGSGAARRARRARGRPVRSRGAGAEAQPQAGPAGGPPARGLGAPVDRRRRRRLPRSGGTAGTARGRLVASHHDRQPRRVRRRRSSVVLSRLRAGQHPRLRHVRLRPVAGDAARRSRLHGLRLLGEAFLLLAFAMLAAGEPHGSLRIPDVVAALPGSPWRDAALALLIAGFGAKMGLVPLTAGCRSPMRRRRSRPRPCSAARASRPA